MTRRKVKPPAKAGGTAHPPAASAPDLASGLYKYTPPVLAALIVPEPGAVPVPPSKLVLVKGTRLRFVAARKD